MPFIVIVAGGESVGFPLSSSVADTDASGSDVSDESAGFSVAGLSVSGWFVGFSVDDAAPVIVDSVVVSSEGSFLQPYKADSMTVASNIANITDITRIFMFLISLMFFY